VEGCYFCHDEDQKGLHRGALHEKCIDHKEAWGPTSKYAGTTKRTLERRKSILRSFLARTKAGEHPTKVKRDLMREYGYKSREAVDTAIRTAKR